MTKFVITYFDGDGYPSVWFDSLEELNQFIEKESIDDMDITDIVEVEVKRVIRSFDREKEIDRLLEESASNFNRKKNILFGNVAIAVGNG